MRFCSLLPLFCTTLNLLVCLQWYIIMSVVLVKKFCWAKICLNFLAAYTFSCTGRKHRRPGTSILPPTILFWCLLSLCSSWLADTRKQLRGKQFEYGHFPPVYPKWYETHTEFPNLSPKFPHEKFIFRKDIFNHHTWTEVILESQGRLPFTGFHYRTVYGTSFSSQHHCNLPPSSYFGGTVTRIW